MLYDRKSLLDVRESDKLVLCVLVTLLASLGVLFYLLLLLLFPVFGLTRLSEYSYQSAAPLPEKDVHHIPIVHTDDVRPVFYLSLSVCFFWWFCLMSYPFVRVFVYVFVCVCVCVCVCVSLMGYGRGSTAPLLVPEEHNRYEQLCTSVLL